MKFGMFFLGEYVAMFASSAIIVTLFFGGYQIPWLATETMVAYAQPIAIVLMLLLPVITYYFTNWIRKNNVSHYYRPNDPLVREANVYIKICWILAAAVELILLTLVVINPSADGVRIFVVLLQMATFLLKATIMCFVYVWVRWTLPRFRYDQLQKLGWQILLPMSLVNIFITSAVVVALS